MEMEMYQKISERVLSDIQSNTSVDNLLTDVESAIRNGDSQHAYELSLRATQAVPNNIEFWYLRASLATSLEERILCVNRLNEIAPEHRDKHNVAFFALKEFLDRDPFLAYREETEALYRVENADGMILSIPKRRAATTSYPDKKQDKLTAAYRWLTLAFLSLMFAGLGTLIFAPLAIWAALNANQSNGSHADEVGAVVVSLIAAILFFIGLMFSYLFVIHLTG
jgi:hypothetical protein